MKCQELKTSLRVPSSVFLKEKRATDTFFSEKVSDPYRSIENLKDTLVINWFHDQDEFTNKHINRITQKERIKTRIKELTKVGGGYVTSNLEIADNGYHFYLKKKNSEKVAKLYYRKSFEGQEELLFDPKDFDTSSSDTYSINFIQPNWGATKIAVGFTKNDEEFSTLTILDVGTKKLIKTPLTNTWPSELGGTQWLPDNTGFIYQSIPVIDKNSEDYILNTEAALYILEDKSASKKVLFSKNKFPEFNLKEEDFPIIHIRNREDKYMFCEIGGASNMIDYYYAQMPNPNQFDNLSWDLLYKKEDKITSFKVKKDELYFLTSKNAPKFKLCKTSLSNPDFDNPNLIIAESNDFVITDFALVNKGIFYVKVRNGVEARLFHLDKGIEKELPLPKSSGKINLSSNGYKNNDLWIEIEGWTSKKERYRYNFETHAFEQENLSPIEQYKTLEDVVVEEIEVPSHDGTMVPLSIIYKKGLKKDKNNRLLINAYGSYGWSNSPKLYSYLLHWIDNGGVYAVVHVRGGGEKGDAWHKAGYKATKPNTWKDLIACTEYFVENKYTTPDKIALWGASAGGICMGRAITERPDLYAAAIIRVGDLNALRMEFAPNGKNNMKEFGTVKDSVEFRALYKMDAYQHIKDNVAYPAVYLTAGMNDARVPAWQPAKFAARLQEATSSRKPVLLKVNFEGGHGFDALQERKDEELADIISFALWQTGHPDFQPKHY